MMVMMLTMLTTVMIITTATSTTTAMVMMALLLLLLLLLLLRQVVLRCYTEAVPMVQQVRADFYVRLHILVVFGQVTAAADRGFPATANAADATDAIGHRSICTSTSAATAAAAVAAIQSVRLASLFVEFHIS